jgi:hypothetical protein
MSVCNNWTKFFDKLDPFIEKVFEENNGVLTYKDWCEKCEPQISDFVLRALFDVVEEEFESNRVKMTRRKSF